MYNLSAKASSRIALNRSLISIAIGAFFLTINLREALLFQKVLLLQLVLAVPLLLTSTLAYSKIGYRGQTEKWNTLGWVTFIFGYAFLLNVMGILIGKSIGVMMAIIFFVFSGLLSLIYSFVDISYSNSVVKERLIKDALFISIQFVLGVLVVLGFI